MSGMLHQQEHYREAVERHQDEARAWARDRALSQKAQARRAESRVATDTQAVGQQIASAPERHAEHKRLRRLIALVSPTMALAVLIGILI